MPDRFSALAAGHALAMHAASALEERGFVVLPGIVAAESMERLLAAHDEAMTSATSRSSRGAWRTGILYRCN